MKKRILSLLMSVAMIVTMMPVQAAFAEETMTADAQGQWEYNNTGWWYRYENGGYPYNQFEVINGSKYHFGNSGYMDKGWIYTGDAWYYACASGALMTGGWTWVGDYCYYFDDDGVMAHDSFIGSSYVNSSGAWVSSGWVYRNNGWWYLYSGGGRANNCFETINGQIYHFDSDGYVETGWLHTGGKWYYAYGSGALAKDGWAWIGDKCYHFDGNGVMAQATIVDGCYVDYSGAWVTYGWIKNENGWWYKYENGGYPWSQFLTINGAVYHFDSNGYLQTGWQKIDGKWYYFYGSGQMVTGREQVGGTWYYFHEDGHMAQDETIDGYYYDESGAGSEAKPDKPDVKPNPGPEEPSGWVSEKDGWKYYYPAGNFAYGGLVDIAGSTYYFDNRGYMQTGWKEIKGSWYYFYGSGQMVKSRTMAINGYWYYFHEDGHMAQNETIDGCYYGESGARAADRWESDGNGWRYVYSAGGYACNEFKTISGSRYHFDKNGYRETGWFKVGGDDYYAYSDGKMAQGVAAIDGNTYIFDSKDALKETRNLGIDVSAFQDKIDWAGVKSAGVDFAIIRAAGRFGASGKMFRDSYFYSNIKGAAENGIDVGAYFYTQAVTPEEAVEEAQFICDMLEGYEVKYPVAIDTEYVDGCRHNNLTRQERTDVVKAFCEEVKRQGYEPMIYSNLTWLNKRLDMSQLKDYKVWVAQYNDTCDYRGDYCCWQYTSGGHIAGIDGRVDLNTWYD